MQSERQREQILTLILENENVSDLQNQSVTVVHPLIMSLHRSTRLWTSSALPWKPRVSQAVTSGRCVVMLPCCVSGTLSTHRETGTRVSTQGQGTPENCPKETHHLPVSCLLSPPLSPVSCLLPQSVGGVHPVHQPIRSSEIHHEVEEVKVGGWNRRSAARRSGLSVGHMTSSGVSEGQVAAGLRGRGRG